MKFLLLVAGVLAFAFVLVGAANTHGPVTQRAVIDLSSFSDSGVSGTAQVTQGTGGYIFVRAKGMNSGSQYGVAVMTTRCNAVLHLLNPMTADLAGDGTSTSKVDGISSGSWLGILSTNATNGDVVACGGTWRDGGGEPSIPTDTPTPPAGGTVVPVTTPTPLPTAPGGKPQPPGS